MMTRLPPAAALLPAPILAQPGLLLDLSRNNPGLQGIDPTDVQAFGDWIQQQLRAQGCSWGLGGYGEDRSLYEMSSLFGVGADVRSLHLGLDIWLPAGTPVFAPWAGVIHSIGQNDAHGDYGPTVLLQHRLDDGSEWFSLYGHLARASVTHWSAGQSVAAGQLLARLGEAHENVGWVPHLHFQIMRDIGDARGDYPGVCHAKDREQWLGNCLDPLPVLRIHCSEIISK